MPTYQYACTECDHRFEAVQSFSDDALTVCPECGGTLRKVYSAVGVVFKGSGFYRTDSRANGSKSSSASPAASSNGSSKESSNGASKDSSTGSKSDSSKPAASTSSSSTGSGSAA